MDRESSPAESSSIVVLNHERNAAQLPDNFSDGNYQLFYSRSPYEDVIWSQVVAVAVFCAVGLVAIILWNPRHVPIADLLPGFGIVAALCGLAMALGFWLKQLLIYHISLSSNGMEFSKGWGSDLLNRLKRNWDDLYSVEMVEIDVGSNSDLQSKLRHLNQVIWYGDGTLNTRQSLRFNFKSGGAANVWLSRFNRLQLKCLFLAIENWIEPSKLSRDVVRAKNMLLIECAGDGSYTDVWMQDLEDKFSTTSFAPLISGQCLQDSTYRITTELSTRGRSAVYLGSNKTGQPVVIKELVAPSDSNSIESQKQKEMFHREVRLLLKVDHEKIARVLDFFTESDRDYIVIEYRQGLSLRQKYHLGERLDEADVIDVLKQLLEVVQFLHHMDPPIIHRDLTPDNIILQKDGTIAVVDFGAANEYLGGVTSTLVGKQSYMPPEQVRGKASPASDIYAIGATAYFLLTAEDPEALSESSPRSRVDSVSASLDEVIRKCTRIEPEDRYASCEEVLDALKESLSHVR